MELEEFVTYFAGIFDDTDPNLINASTCFHDIDEWSSLTGMSCIALARRLYGKKISGAELRACSTVEDVFNLIKNK